MNIFETFANLRESMKAEFPERSRRRTWRAHSVSSGALCGCIVWNHWNVSSQHTPLSTQIRSARWHLLYLPQHLLSIRPPSFFHCQSISIQHGTVYQIPSGIRSVTEAVFRRLLKTLLFAWYCRSEHVRDFPIMRYTDSLIVVYSDEMTDVCSHWMCTEVVW